MPTIIDQNGKGYRPVRLKEEKQFEVIVEKLADSIFGLTSVYVPIKKRVRRDNLITIPDGYVIDVADNDNPKFYVVENEIVSHDPFKHIGIQMLRFVTSFEKIQVDVKHFIMEYITSHKRLMSRLEGAREHSDSRNIDNYMDKAIYGNFHGIVIIDEKQDELTHVLQKINADIYVLELKTYEAEDGTRAYLVDTLYGEEEFAPAVREDRGKSRYSSAEIALQRERRLKRRMKCDTIVVPAQEDGFKRVFLGENRWHEIRIGPAMMDRIKYIAAYQVAPVSAITHIAEVENIRPYKDSGKYIVQFKQPAKQIGPIKPRDTRFSPQGPVYAQSDRLLNAKTLEDALT
jgi:hypothetical protein